MIDLINKEKIQADNYITGFLVLFFLGFAMFFRLEWIMSVIIYPFVALFFFGLLKIINDTNRRSRGNEKNLNRTLLGIVSMLFSVFFLCFILIQPNMSFQNIINLIAFPMVIVGVAGIIKGTLISSYSVIYRTINVIIGFVTIIVCGLAFFSPYFIPQEFNWLHMISLSLALLVNVLGRAALYLSEYGLSLSHIRNFLLFLYIISDYLIYINDEGNVILDKIQ